MSEKIAVHCKTEEEWNRVKKEMANKGVPPHVGPLYAWDDYKDRSCLAAKNGHQSFSPKDYWEHEGYTIIPASEYLREEEFKVGDRVECIDGDDREQIASGLIYTISDIIMDKENCRLEGIDNRYSFRKERFKLASTKQPNKPIKEDSNMSEIKSNFIEAFPNDTKLAIKMSARFGAQYLDNDRDRLALERDKEALVKIVEDEEKAAVAAEKAAKKK